MTSNLDQLHDEISRHQVEQRYEPGDLIKMLDYIDRLLAEVDGLRSRVRSLEDFRANSGTYNP